MIARPGSLQPLFTAKALGNHHGLEYCEWLNVNITWQLASKFSQCELPLAGWSVSVQSHSPFSALLQSTFCFKISSYLDFIRNSASRKDLVKIRISNHKLRIKTGRYNQTSRNDRFCPICNSGIIEDEFIFSSIVQNIQSQGRNSTIKSNKILSTLISYLTQN